jgi:hypothetical protein
MRPPLIYGVNLQPTISLKSALARLLATSITSSLAAVPENPSSCLRQSLMRMALLGMETERIAP